MSVTPSSALYAFPSDLVDEGVSAVVERARELGTGIALAMAYHQARDLIPHAGAKPRIRYRRDGVFFRPSASWPPDAPLPRLQADAELAAAAQLITEHGDIPLEAWTVFLHNTGMGEDHPEMASLTCFGDQILSNLCPTNPVVARYAEALAGDVADLGLDVIAEALSGQTFGHGHHHERAFTPLGSGEQAMLGICFCPHCLAAASALGIDGEAIAATARDHLQRAFATEAGTPATRDALADRLGGDVLEYLRVQERAVTLLTRRVAARVRAAGRRLSFMDLTGAVLGYDDGTPTGAPAADHAWRIGVDPESIAREVDSYTILGYVREPQRLRDDVASYRAVLGATPLRVILRPGFPDADDAAHLRAHVAAARDGGADQVDFYNYGMYDQAVLDRIPEALR